MSSAKSKSHNDSSLDHLIPPVLLSVVLCNTQSIATANNSNSELEEHSQQRLTKDGVHLGRSRGGSSWQTRMASKCGPTCPIGCGM